MRRLQWFHSNVVWPPTLMVVLFVVFYGVATLGLWFVEFAESRVQGFVSENHEIARIQLAALVFAALIYAAYRLIRFHPACNQAYATWLRLSPWTAEKPLPMGPVHPVWQDVAVIGALTILGWWHAPRQVELPAMSFGLTYLAGMTLLLAFTRRWWSCLILGFLWPTLLLPGIGAVTTTVLLMFIVAVAWHGHRQSLRAFPWSSAALPRRQQPLLQREVNIDVAPVKTSTVGWPFTALSPKPQFYSVSMRTSFWISALIGWWTYCVMQRGKLEPMTELVVMLAIFAALIRLAIYCGGITTPFNVRGRIASGRLIVPGFDKVFLTPVASVGLAILGGIIIRHWKEWHPAVEACFVAAIWFILLSGGPTLRNWFLTGQHRFYPSGVQKRTLRPT